jgi:hypothetical protein
MRSGFSSPSLPMVKEVFAGQGKNKKGDRSFLTFSLSHLFFFAFKSAHFR